MHAISLFLALCAPTLIHADSIWTPHIGSNYAPAPPPDKRPPISRNATHDPSLLKWQIPAIIGSYLGVVLFIGICILSFGKRMRKEAQSGLKPISREMLSPKSRFDTSPVSPSGSSVMWKRWGASPILNRNKSDASKKAPSVVSFDPTVLENDKAKREEEMSRIYGEIMSQGYDIKAPKILDVREQQMQDHMGPKSPGLNELHRGPSTMSRSFSQRDPPQTKSSQQPQANVTQLQYTQPIQGLYPPQGHSRMPSVPMSGQPDFYPTEMLATSPSNAPMSARPMSTETTAPPPYSHSRQFSGQSRRSGRTASIRSLTISNPILIPSVEDEIAAEARIPKPERYYRDPGRPPTPPTAGLGGKMERPTTMIEDESDEESERIREELRSARDSGSIIADDSDEEILTDDEFDHERHMNNTPESIIGSYAEPRTPRTPQPASPRAERPARRPAADRLAPAASPTSPAFTLDQDPPPQHPASEVPSMRAQTKAPPPALAVHPPSRTTTPAGTSLRTQTKTPPASLPFRAIHPPLASPGLTSPGFALSPGLPNAPNQLISPGGTKTTFLSPRRDRFPAGMVPLSGYGLQPNTAALFSAGLASPYSPSYMGNVPMTPVTPHLTTRRERQEEKRERGRRAPTEQDIVEDEETMWGDAYR